MTHDIVIVRVLGGGGAAGMIGAGLSRILTKRRKAETRKLSRQKELTDFLAVWKGEITTENAANLPLVYNRELPHLQTTAAAVRDCRGEMERVRFNELIGNLSRLTTGQITRPQANHRRK
jgi:hypothetical protein